MLETQNIPSHHEYATKFDIKLQSDDILLTDGNTRYFKENLFEGKVPEQNKRLVKSGSESSQGVPLEYSVFSAHELAELSQEDPSFLLDILNALGDEFKQFDFMSRKSTARKLLERGMTDKVREYNIDFALQLRLLRQQILGIQKYMDLVGPASANNPQLSQQRAKLRSIVANAEAQLYDPDLTTLLAEMKQYLAKFKIY